MIVKTEKISNLSVWTERDLNEKNTIKYKKVVNMDLNEKKALSAKCRKCLIFLVGLRGFEPPTN